MGGSLTKAAFCAALIGFACAFAWSRLEQPVAACGVFGPYDFDTYEAENYVPAYNKAINVAAIGQAVVGSWTIASGETIDVTYQGLESGPRGARAARSTDYRIPPVIFKSIAWIEASWQHAAPPGGPAVPWGGVGAVIRSFDCGYGLGQITSGMSNSGVTGALMTGALKGASSIQATNATLFLAGDGIRIKAASGPEEINEITGKNGSTLTLAKPLANAYPSGAGVSTLGGRPTARQAIIGAHPAFNLAEGVRILADKWNSSPEARPVAGNGDPTALEDWYYAIWSYNGFAFSNHPLNPSRNALRPNLYHCGDSSAPGFGQFREDDFTYPERVYGCMVYPPQVPYPQGSATRVRLYESAPVTMPSVRAENPPQAWLDAFDPQNFIDCQAAGFSGGCAAMDYPTSIPEREIWTRTDPTEVNPADAIGFLGAPVLQVTGPTTANLAVPASGTPGSVQVVVSNTGTWLAPFRVRTSMPWLIARHPTDPATRTLDGGVAVGKEVTVVVTSAPRVTQAGYDSILMVTVDPARYPGGTQTAKLWVEPLYGAGSVFELTVTAIGSSPAPGPNRAIIPFAVKDH
jgi:hypothetical protein